LARENLTYFVKGIAAHLVSKDVLESLPQKYFVARNSTLLRWKAQVEQLRGNPEISIPVPTTTTNLGGDGTSTTTAIPKNDAIGGGGIAKARMSTGTSLPDPWLLLAKSAINYAASNGQTLMPVPEDADSSDDNDDDYDDDDYDCNGNPNKESNNNGKKEDEKVSAVQTEFYLGALHRGGFGCEENESTA
jgi:hypothetical protein